MCAACHRLEGVGHQIGKDLKAIGDHSAESILVSILDPNREVDPAYVNYVALTNDGRAASGYIAAETAVSVTLKRADDASDTLLCRDIDQLQSSGCRSCRKDSRKSSRSKISPISSRI